MKRLDELLNEEYIEENKGEIEHRLKVGERFRIKQLIAMLGITALVITGISAGTAGVVVKSTQDKIVTKITGEVNTLVKNQSGLPEDEQNKLVSKVLERTENTLKGGGSILTEQDVAEIVEVMNTDVYNQFSDYISYEDFNSTVNDILASVKEAQGENVSTEQIIEKLKEVYDSKINQSIEELAKADENIDSRIDEIDSAKQKELDSLDGRTDKAEDNILANRQLINELRDNLTSNMQQGNTQLTDMMNQNNTQFQQSLTDLSNTVNTDITQRIDTLNGTLTTSLEQHEQQNETDFNTVNQHIGNLETLSTNNKGSVVEAINEVFQSVSDGKARVASAITDAGIDTDEDATFNTMANNISRIYADAFRKGMESVSTPAANVVYNYHYHVDYRGNRTNATMLSTCGGCYTTPKYHQHTSSCYGRCPGTMVYECHIAGDMHAGYYIWQYRCTTCGNRYQWRDDDPRPQTLDHEYRTFACTNTSVLKCTISPGALEGYTTSCGHQNGEILSATIIFSDDDTGSGASTFSSRSSNENISTYNQNGTTYNIIEDD